MLGLLISPGSLGASTLRPRIEENHVILEFAPDLPGSWQLQWTTGSDYQFTDVPDVIYRMDPSDTPVTIPVGPITSEPRLYRFRQLDGTSSGVTRPVHPLARAQVVMLLSAGQSVSNGYNTKALLSTTQPYDNVTFHYGPRAWRQWSWGMVPLVETDFPDATGQWGIFWETPCSGWANGLTSLRIVEDGIDYRTDDQRFFAASPGVQGKTIEALATTYRDVFIRQVQSSRDQAVANGQSFSVGAITWLHGAANAQNNRADYAAKLQAYIDDLDAAVMAITGQTERPRWLLVPTASNTRIAAFPLAQADVAAANPHVHLVDACYHLALVDGLHPSADEARHLGRLLAKATKRLLYDGAVRVGVAPKLATRAGHQVRITFAADYPLTFDTDHGSVLNQGFSLTDDLGTLTLTALTVEDRTVTLTASRPIGPGAFVRYALDYPYVSVPSGQPAWLGAAGTLRDTDPLVIDGEAVPSFCPPFDLSISN